VAEKSHYYPTPCTALWGEGKGRCYLYGSEDLLNENVSYAQIIIKSLLKMAFLMKTYETKTLGKIFYEEFLIKKKYFTEAIQDLFSFLLKRLFKFPSSED
jgi:hypothetical protein